MSKFFRRLFHIFFDEFRQICHDEGILIFTVLLPLGYPLLYALIYSTEVQRELPVCVVDDSKTSRSREFICRVNATPEVLVARHAVNMDEARELMRRREVYAIVRIPDTFDDDLWQGRQTVVGIYSDLTSMLFYKVVYLGVVNVAQDMNRHIKVYEKQGPSTPREEQVAAKPIDFEHVMLYNPQGGFAAFLIPGVLMLIIQQALVLSISMSTGRYRERFGDHFIPRHDDYRHAFTIVLGRGLPYILIFLVMACYMNVCVTRIFTLPALTHFGTFLHFIIPYVMASTFLGFALSRVVRHREDCILIYVFMSVPLLFLSGVSWPSASIPWYWKFVGMFAPSTHGINAYVRISGMGACVDDIHAESLALWILAGAYFLWACYLYRRDIERVFAADR